VRKVERLEFADFAKIVDAYKKESDRAAAVLAAAFLESFLGDYLRAFFVDDPEPAKLLEENRLLGSFGARAQVAYAFGLVTPAVASDLRYIGKIRNLFAHDISELSFSSPRVKDLCGNLSAAKSVPIPGGGEVAEADPRQQYLGAFAATVVFLYNGRLERERQQAGREAADSHHAP